MSPFITTKIPTEFEDDDTVAPWADFTPENQAAKFAELEAFNARIPGARRCRRRRPCRSRRARLAASASMAISDAAAACLAPRARRPGARRRRGRRWPGKESAWATARRRRTEVEPVAGRHNAARTAVEPPRPAVDRRVDGLVVRVEGARAVGGVAPLRVRRLGPPTRKSSRPASDEDIVRVEVRDLDVAHSPNGQRAR